jgi:lipid-binding SYLF domain-containing protein
MNFKESFMKTSRIIPVILSVFFMCVFLTPAKSQDKQQDKIVAATQVLQDFSKMKESIPAELLKVTEGIIVVPKMINAGFVLAGKRGKGLAMVKLANGSWSNPVFVTITGGSVGFQAGVQSVDLVLIFKSHETLEDIGKGSFTLGGDISVTAGPVGRSSSASTDYKLEAEVYSYSRSKGLFAGISLAGSAISIDEKANNSFYNNQQDAKELFSNSTENTSASVKKMKSVLKDMYK